MQYCFRIILTLVEMYIEIGYLALDAADTVILNVGDALD